MFITASEVSAPINWALVQLSRTRYNWTSSFFRLKVTTTFGLNPQRSFCDPYARRESTRRSALTHFAGGVRMLFSISFAPKVPSRGSMSWTRTWSARRKIRHASAPKAAAGRCLLAWAFPKGLPALAVWGANPKRRWRINAGRISAGAITLAGLLIAVLTIPCF